MPTHPGKIALALALLVAVWIGVYWWWDPKPPITFEPTTASSAEPEPPAAVEPAPREPLVVPREPDAKATPVPEGPRVAVVPPEYVEYTIQPGDTLASLSRRFFGSSSRADAIARMNPTMSPPNMKPGRVIKIPKDPNNIQGKPAPQEAEPTPPQASEGATASAEHKVSRGDTLSGIAKRYYGSSHPRYVERLLDANKGVISAPEDLRPGQVLKIPPK